jgi:WD40 repeat protein
VRELGRGGLGVVYLARQLKARRPVALKMLLHAGHPTDPEQQRFRIEAEAVARLQHPGIVQVFEVGDCRGYPFFSMEYAEGGNLADKLAGNPLPAEQAARLVRALAEAVQHAHERGIVHRDLKPHNVLLSFSGGSQNSAGPPQAPFCEPPLNEAVPKITDFGLARLAGGLAPTQSGAITPSYMAPEQAAGKNQDVGPPADIYGLGAILYECLTGRPPFKAATPRDTLMQVVADEPVLPRQLQSEVPRDLETICLKCLQKEPHKRYASASALADDLGAYLDNRPIQARPARLRERGLKWVRRRPAVVALLALVVLVTAVGFALVTAYDKARQEAVQKARDEEQARHEMARQKERAEKNAGEARRLQGVAQGEATARGRELEWVRQLGFTAQVGRAAALWDRDPPQGLRALRDTGLCLPALRDFAWGYYYRLCQRDGGTLASSAGSIQAFALSPDGTTLATSTPGGALVLWDAGTGKMRARLKGKGGAVLSVAFSLDGTLLASGHAGGSAKLWDVRSGKLKKTLRNPKARKGWVVTSVAFSPDGKLVACGGGRRNPRLRTSGTTWADGAVHLWEVGKAGRGRALLAGNSGGVTCLAFSPDGGTLAAAIAHGSHVKLIDVPTGKTTVLSIEGGWVQSVAFSPDGDTLAFGNSVPHVLLYDRVERRLIARLRGHRNDVFSLAFRPDGKILASGASDGSVRLWDVSNRRQQLLLDDFSGRACSLSFTSDGNTLLAGTRRGVRRWDVSQRMAETFFALSRGVRAIAASDDGRLLVTGGLPTHGSAVRVWDARSGVERFALPQHRQTVTCVAVSAGKLLATGSEDRTVRLYDLTTRKELHVFKGHRNAISGVVLTPDGKTLVTASLDGAVKVWSVAQCRERTDLRITTTGSPTLSLSANGRSLAVAQRTGVVIWDLVSGKSEPAGSFRASGPVAVALAPDGKTVAVASPFAGLYDRAARRWQSMPEAGRVHGVAFSPDGRTVAFGCDDRTVKLYDVAARHLRAVLPGHTREVTALVFSPDGGTLFSGSASPAGVRFRPGGEVKVWRSIAPLAELAGVDRAAAR